MMAAAELRECFSEAMLKGYDLIQVDLRGVSFLDMAGIRPLPEARAEATRQGVFLVVTGPSRAARRLLGLIGIDYLLQTTSVPLAGLPTSALRRVDDQRTSTRDR